MLNRTLHYHLRNYFLENPELLKILLKSFYVDDFVSRKDTKPENFDLCLQIKECVAQASLSLHKWACSDPEIMKLLNEKEVSPCHDNGVSQDDTTFAKLSVGGSPQEVNAKEGRKVLRINWDTEHDILSVNFEKIVEFSHSLKPTKTNLLRKIASVCFRKPVH